MRRFSTSEFEEFFRSVDKELRTRCVIVLIGGGAVGLRFKGSHVTSDLDLWSASKPFWAAADRVNAKREEPIPVQKATIAEPPYSFEERLTRLPISGLKKLTVLVPEAHDLALLKIARAEAHDLDAIEDIHAEEKLNLETLIERYLETVSQVVGSVAGHRLNFLAAVARLFGEEKAAEVEARLSKSRGHS